MFVLHSCWFVPSVSSCVSVLYSHQKYKTFNKIKGSKRVLGYYLATVVIETFERIAGRYKVIVDYLSFDIPSEKRFDDKFKVTIDDKNKQYY